MSDSSVSSAFEAFPVDVLRIIFANVARDSPDVLAKVSISCREPIIRSTTQSAAKEALSPLWPAEPTTSSDGNKQANPMKRLWETQNSFPLWSCDNCKFQFCGIRCCGFRDPEEAKTYTGDSYHGYHQNRDFIGPIPVPSGCGSVFFYDSFSGTAKCPAHPQKEFKLHCQCNRGPINSATSFLTPQKNTVFTKNEILSALKNVTPFVDDKSPMATCTACGWSVEGALCASEIGSKKHDKPIPMPRNGFFERVACAYVWTCSEGCARSNQGGYYANSTCFCNCVQGQDVPCYMRIINYEERHFPPTN